MQLGIAIFGGILIAIGGLIVYFTFKPPTINLTSLFKINGMSAK